MHIVEFSLHARDLFHTMDQSVFPHFIMNILMHIEINNF